MIDSLMDEDGMSYEEAMEFIDFNTVRGIDYMPDPKPVILYRFPEE